jgi:hypothetical protein
MVVFNFMKNCSICKQTKSFDDFYFNKNNKDNYFNYCKKCHKYKTVKKQKENLLLKNEEISFLNNEFFIEHSFTGLLVSNLGRIFSPYRENGIKRYAHFLKQTKMNNGYFTVSFNGKHLFVHRLVCETFISNKENKTHINHIDLNKENNNLYNLEWCSHLENIEHAKINDAYSRKLKREDVFYIRNSKESVDFLSNKFNVSKTNIRFIINKKIWNHI